jgi:3-(3-hydroxy-phenyl)propionate hydroxylase
VREVVRDGFTVLLAGRDDEDVVARAAGAVTGAPVTTLSLERIDATGALAAALGAVPGEAWLIRPDAHIAAVLPTATAEGLAAAVRRSLGYPR